MSHVVWMLIFDGRYAPFPPLPRPRLYRVKSSLVCGALLASAAAFAMTELTHARMRGVSSAVTQEAALLSLAALSSSVVLLVVAGRGTHLLGCNPACLAANSFAVSWAMQFSAHLLVRAPRPAACSHLLCVLTPQPGHRVHGAVSLLSTAHGFGPGRRCGYHVGSSASASTSDRRRVCKGQSVEHRPLRVSLTLRNAACSILHTRTCASSLRKTANVETRCLRKKKACRGQRSWRRRLSRLKRQ